MTDLLAPLPLPRGRPIANRLVLSALTNQQSRADGVLSDDEFRWLTMRASGGFGMLLTCAAHVQPCGQGFPGQLGVFSDAHLEGLTRLAAGMKAHGAPAAVQLHHAGDRSPADLVRDPVSASDQPETKARGLTTAEVERLVEDFVVAAVRSQRAGFDGVEIHGAHGYIISQFLSPETNRRTDRYGGALENRARLLTEIVAGVRRECRDDFQLGVRLSPDRFGLSICEGRALASELMAGGDLDYLDFSLWDVNKVPQDPLYADRTLMDCFLDLPRGRTRIGVAGKIRSAADARAACEAGADFVLLGRAAILHHDFPRRVEAEADFKPLEIPVPADHLRAEGLGEPFVDYLKTWPNFVTSEPARSPATVE